MDPCMHVTAREQYQMSHPALSLVTGPVTEAGTRLMVSKCQQSSCLHSLQFWSSWHMSAHTWLYGWTQRLQTQLVTLAQQVFFPAEHLLSSPELSTLFLSWSYCETP